MDVTDTDPARQLRVMVVDPDERTRQSLTGLLAIGRRCAVVGGAGTSADALDVADRLRPDLVIVDPRLPDVDAGLAFIATLRERLPAVRILVMSRTDAGEPGPSDFGADAVVRKTFRAQELVDAVLAACAGRGA